jgi:hypothetical protein
VAVIPARVAESVTDPPTVIVEEESVVVIVTTVGCVTMTLAVPLLEL